MIRSIKKYFTSRQGKSEGVRVKGTRLARMAEGLERYAEAATFAEAGVQDVAQNMVGQWIEQPSKILVVGDEYGFSNALIDYSIAFAKRMSYEIVALNCVPEGHQGPKEIDPKDLVESGEAGSTAHGGAGRLASLAVRDGVGIKHLVRFGAAEGCIREVHREFPRLEFVITEPDVIPEGARAPVIPVFCLAQ